MLGLTGFVFRSMCTLRPLSIGIDTVTFPPKPISTESQSSPSAVTSLSGSAEGRPCVTAEQTSLPGTRSSSRESDSAALGCPRQLFLIDKGKSFAPQLCFRSYNCWFLEV